MMNRNERQTVERSVAILGQVADVCNGVCETAGDRPGMWEHGHIAALVGVALDDLRELQDEPAVTNSPTVSPAQKRGTGNGF